MSAGCCRFSCPACDAQSAISDDDRGAEVHENEWRREGTVFVRRMSTRAGQFIAHVTFDSAYCAWAASVLHNGYTVFVALLDGRLEATDACATAVEETTKLVVSE